MDTIDYTYTPHTVIAPETVVGEIRRLIASLGTDLAQLEEALTAVEEPLPVIELEE
jgi:hypothetical protein